ncbi:MAG: methyltransferase domain-containing protein [Planctomycetales bacterium]|nr:methyltransferase domain-containing protein [Planctomycetales bacterium]
MSEVQVQDQMFDLRCTVRNCGQVLRLADTCLRCDNGHSFDRAKQGYWNLTQPQDSKSSTPGDSDAAVEARHRWLQSGRMNGFTEFLQTWVDDCLGVSGDEENVRVIDLGCGEGTFGKALFHDRSVTYCGIDLSKRAIKLAARSWPQATWVLANADRRLPIVDVGVSLAVSLFGRRPCEGLHRVLVSGGHCIFAVPAADDLIELREQVQLEGRQRNRSSAIIDEFAKAGFELVEHSNWRTNVLLDADSISDAMAMTYRAFRFSQQQRMEAISSANVTLAAELLLMKKTA